MNQFFRYCDEVNCLGQYAIGSKDQYQMMLTAWLRAYNYDVLFQDIEYILACDKCGHIESVIEYYKEEYKPNAQEKIEGVIINPKQRFFFDCLNNELRPKEEVKDWLNIKYIVTEEFPEQNYKHYLQQAKKLGVTPEPQSQYEARYREDKADWLTQFPNGKRFTVRCYDERIADRSSNLGIFLSLNDAINAAR